MTGHTGWRRCVIAAIALTTLVMPQLPAQATRERSVADWVCDFEWQDGKHQVKQLIRCAARRWRVPGGPDKAVAVARCESGFNPEAYDSGNAGVFQHAVPYWPDRADRWGFPDRSVYNGRANVIVSIRMVHRWGWDAWSCA